MLNFLLTAIFFFSFLFVTLCVRVCLLAEDLSERARGDEESPKDDGPNSDGPKSCRREMSWSNTNSEEETALQIKEKGTSSTTICPSCGLTIKLQDNKSISTGIQDLPGLPAGVKFDPSDQEILQHLEAKLLSRSHPLIDEFIPTIQGQNGICYTHPEKLPGVSKDGQIRHFFHRPSKAYTTGTRKRRKVHSDATGDGETRWHKTGKTRPISAAANIKGYKKILVLYTNYGRQRKPEKTNWVMHQYHLGDNEEEKDGELVLSKVFYQTQPRQCGSSAAIKEASSMEASRNPFLKSNAASFPDYYAAPTLISYGVDRDGPTPVIPNMVVNGDRSSSFIRLPSSASKGK